MTSLENLRKAAKRRLRALRKRNPSATLRDVQHALAREHGHESWPAMLASVAGEQGLPAVSVLQLGLHTNELSVCTFTPDQQRALTAAEEEHPVQLWDLQTGACVRVFDEHTRPVWALEWHSDVRHFLSGSFDGTLRLWNADSGQLLRVFDDGWPIRSVAWSPDERFALTGSPRHLRIWHVQTGRSVQTFTGHTNGVYSVQWSPDQRRILSGSTDRTIRMWDVETGRCLRVLGGHTYHVHSAVSGSDGMHAVSCGDDVRMWNVETGECECVLAGHTDTIRTVRWSGDERRILSASHDGTIRIWDLATRQCVHTFTGHSAGVINAVWGRSGRQVYSCDWRGEIRVWNAR